MKSALVLIDIQNDFVEKGVFDIQGAADVIPIINDIRAKYDQKFSSIFLVTDQRQETHISFKDSPYAKEENLPFDEIYNIKLQREISSLLCKRDKRCRIIL